MEEADVRAYFEQFGTITDMVRMTDKATGTCQTIIEPSKILINKPNMKIRLADSFSLCTDPDPAFPKSCGSGSWGPECHIFNKNISNPFWFLDHYYFFNCRKGSVLAQEKKISKNFKKYEIDVFLYFFAKLEGSYETCIRIHIPIRILSGSALLMKITDRNGCKL